MTASWRHMTTSDIEGLLRVADQVHPDLPESAAVFSERVSLWPRGCFVLVEGDEIRGYAISHPIRRDQPPALDSLLGKIDPDADQYYIHDLAIVPDLRGRGYAGQCVERLLTVAGRYPTTCLVSVYGTTAFWGRFGFESRQGNEALAEKLGGYGDDAIYLVRENRK